MQTKHLLPILVLLAACQNKDNTPAEPVPADTIVIEKIDSKTVTPSEPQSPLQQKMLGVWSNEANPDGIFDITDSTFYYAHNYEEYHYQLKDNIIKIKYPNATYIGKVSFKGDTLIMASEEGTAKYWKYRN